ncbi:hypothetical protein F4556_002340 [Kitasatospora gansuensis]|uniref:Uncharacterized protein n=1 Tax=Kitasatospora gansuensis TaxID=258050 RepID=A0A7W7SAA4_9ACTN|nr:hypothetical protein [Kitasatospora gansuensis]MBB4946805.1 hypothetical protein [Kitasatospora gansuensis]
MTTHQAQPASAVVAFRPLVGAERAVEITDEQLHGRRCIGCGTDHHLVDAGHVFTPTGEAPLGWPVRSCARCMATG